VDIGRQVVEQRVERPAKERAMRWLLKEGLTSPAFGPAMAVGRALRPLLPAALKDKVPAAAGSRAKFWPTRSHPRKVLLLLGCVQPAMMPNINSATARVLDAAGIQTLVADEAGCCGAIRTHLGDVEGGLADMRRNIDAWWPLVDGLTSEGKVEAIVMNASGCGVTVKDYGHALAHDPDYADKARRVSALTRDLSELLPALVAPLKPKLRNTRGTLQHGQQLRGGVERHLGELGFDVQLATADSHLCCGSAGTYSVLQPELARQLRDRKLANLAPTEAQAIVSANIGCIQHLQGGTATPVRHWVEVLDEALA
jgi:glycolate oxidase iron-sulfur subunit